MVERGSFDTICHEHLEYYGMHQINLLLRRHGLRAFDVRVNDVNGGSFQVWACHDRGPYSANVAAIDLLLRKERLEGYLTALPLQSLRDATENARRQALDFLGQCASNGKVVHGYGASTKGNTLLQYFGITPRLLPVIADRNADKYGARTPATLIPIISEEESRAAKPDYYFCCRGISVMPFSPVKGHLSSGVESSCFLCLLSRLFPTEMWLREKDVD